MTELYAARDIELLSDLDFFTAPMHALFGDVLDRLRVDNLVVTETDDGHTVTIVLAVTEDLFIQLPNLGAAAGADVALGFGIVVDSADEHPLIYIEIGIEDGTPTFSLQHFPLRIAITNPLLQPVAIEGQAGTSDGFSFEIEGGFAIDADLAISATLDAFSVPPFTIAGTGLVLALDHCRLVIGPDDIDSAITDAGFDATFRGLYADAALFDWDLPLQINGHDVPGIHAGLEGIALGNQGVSAQVQLDWPVAFQGGTFDPAQTEMLGTVAADWQLALARLTLQVRANVPNAVGVTGHLRLPFPEAIFAVEIFLAYRSEDDYETRIALNLGDDEHVDFALGHPDYQLRVSALSISGSLDSDSNLALNGETACDIDLPGCTIAVDSASLSLERTADSETFAFELAEVDIDTLGTVENATLKIVASRDGDGGRALDSLELGATITWSDLSSRIALGTLPDAFPLPPDDAQVTLRASWEDGQLQLSIDAELADVDRLWRFIPDGQRPEVSEATIRIALTVQGSDFDGEAALALRFRLPDAALADALDGVGLGQLVAMDTGNADGWIDGEFKAVVGSGNDGDNALEASLGAPVSLALNLPGLLLPQPPLALTIESITLTLSGAGDEVEGEFGLGGRFHLRPILPTDLGGVVPPVMAQHLEHLLAVAHRAELVGDAALRVGVAGQGAYFAVDCTFDEAGIELDLFDMLVGAAAQLGGTPAGDGGNDIDLDIEVSFALRELSLSVGRVPDSDQDAGDGMPFRFGIAAELGFAGQYTDMVFELSSEALSFGFENLAIPLMIPQLPLARDDLDSLRDPGGAWDLAVWQQDVEPLIDQRLLEAETALDAARAELDAMPDDADAGLRHDLRYRTIPALQKDIFHFTGKKFLTEAILAIHRMLGQLSTTAAQATYQQLVETYQDAVDLSLGWVKFDTGLQFVIAEARFRLPFNDPAAIAVEGSASLRGFAPESPLRPLGDLAFKLGLSADAIYFAVEGGADPIPLPDLGRYDGSGVVIDRLLIGYGYSKNSLKVDFAGELLLSQQLIDDLDTSSRLGAGIRLPANNRLQFKLDLIPIVLGEVDFLLPLIAFDIDLRSDQPPPAATTACAPVWDGLQLNVPGIVRADLKRAKFSPF
ncbi:MAG: hypothetical protein KDI88_02495, partial [Gammaproteobacteria bacterium]|nr:hypothetical protein [Gammaproteobacteria bacterium]